jgi:hypothetical protein
VIVSDVDGSDDHDGDDDVMMIVLSDIVLKLSYLSKITLVFIYLTIRSTSYSYIISYHITIHHTHSHLIHIYHTIHSNTINIH